MTVNPSSSQQGGAKEQQDVNGVTVYSEIIPHVYPASNGNPPYLRIEVQAYTAADYPIAAVYDVEVNSSLYQGYSLYPCSQPTDDVTVAAGQNGAVAEASFCGYPPDGYLPTSDGATYSLQSEHYLDVTTAYEVAVYDTAGLLIYEDPYGFSLLDDDDDDDSGGDSVAVIYAAGIEVFITSVSVDIGGTASSASTQDQTPYIISISPNCQRQCKNPHSAK